MKTEQQIRAALDYYRDLATRAHDYWATRTDDSLQSNYLRVTEYQAKRDALMWVLGEGTDAAPADADYPAHTVFYPDYVTEMERRKAESETFPTCTNYTNNLSSCNGYVSTDYIRTL